MHPTISLLLATDFPTITRRSFDTLQVNLGYRCNQSCLHCHVGASPQRTEMMDDATAALVLEVLRLRKVTICPSALQEKRLREWVRHAAYTYNACNADLKGRIKRWTAENVAAGMSKQEAYFHACQHLDAVLQDASWLVTRFVGNCRCVSWRHGCPPSSCASQLRLALRWLLRCTRFLRRTPAAVREGAIQDLVRAYKANLTMQQANHDHVFNVKYVAMPQRPS